MVPARRVHRRRAASIGTISLRVKETTVRARPAAAWRRIRHRVTTPDARRLLDRLGAEILASLSGAHQKTPSRSPARSAISPSPPFTPHAPYLLPAPPPASPRGGGTGEDNFLSPSGLAAFGLPSSGPPHSRLLFFGHSTGLSMTSCPSVLSQSFTTIFRARGASRDAGPHPTLEGLGTRPAGGAPIAPIPCNGSPPWRGALEMPANPRPTARRARSVGGGAGARLTGSGYPPERVGAGPRCRRDVPRAGNLSEDF